MVNDPSEALQMAGMRCAGGSDPTSVAVRQAAQAQAQRSVAGKIADAIDGDGEHWIPTRTQMWTACGIAAAALGFAIAAFSMALVAILALHHVAPNGW